MPVSNHNHPRTSRAAPVPASADALDEDAATHVEPPELKAIIEAFKREDRFYRKQAKIAYKSRAKSSAFKYEHLLEDHYADDPSFFQWDENRSLDRQDFDYLFYHRAHFKPWVRTCLEIIASKLTHVTLDGDDGYFKKLERNVGWVSHITPIVLGHYRYMNELVRCGLWSNAKNSRRCHIPDLCPLCLWNDHLKVQVQAFGEHSSAFARAQAWWFLTLGFTSNPNNSKWIVKGFDPQVPNPGDGDRGYDPYPVELAQEAPYIGYTDARLLGLIVQEALDELYQSGLVDGYRNKLEGAFRLQPRADTRMNLHGHAVANGSETNPNFIAEQIYTRMQQGLHKYRRHLRHDYYPDVQVCPVATAKDLERCIIYSEKIVPIAKIVADAMAQPEAKRDDGSWKADYCFGLEIKLCQLLNEDIPCVFTKFRYDEELLYLRRRKTVGNMTFNDSGTCIGTEPGWHRKARQKKSERQKEKREKRRKEQAEAEKNGVLVIPHKRQKRTRTNPRRLKRSLGRWASR
jgi:hypothetical protein